MQQIVISFIDDDDNQVTVPLSSISQIKREKESGLVQVDVLGGEQHRTGANLAALEVALEAAGVKVIHWGG